MISGNVLYLMSMENLPILVSMPAYHAQLNLAPTLSALLDFVSHYQGTMPILLTTLMHK